MPIRESIRNLVPYRPGKPIEEVQRELGLESVTKLASNENPLGPSRKALAALKTAVKTVNIYPDGGSHCLRNRLAQKFAVAPMEIVLGNGANELIELAIRTFVTQEDEGIFCQHAFPMFKISCMAHGVPFREIPCGLRFDLDLLQSSISERTRLIYLPNPNNPTGTHVSTDELKGFLAALPARVMLLIDEAYFEFADAADYPDSLQIWKKEQNRQRMIVLRTFSKAYGLAGLRIGYGFASAENVDLIDRVRMPFNISSLAQQAALAAIDDQEHVSRTRSLCLRERKRFMREFSKLGLEPVPSQGNFLLINTRKAAPDRTAIAVYEELLKRGVIVRPMAAWGLESCLRVSVGTRKDNDLLLKALREVLGSES